MAPTKSHFLLTDNIHHRKKYDPFAHRRLYRPYHRRQFHRINVLFTWRHMFKQQQKHNLKHNPYLKNSNFSMKKTIICFFNYFKYVSEQKQWPQWKPSLPKKKKMPNLFYISFWNWPTNLALLSTKTLWNKWLSQKQSKFFNPSWKKFNIQPVICHS